VVDWKKENAQFPSVGSHLLSLIRRQLEQPSYSRVTIRIAKSPAIR